MIFCSTSELIRTKECFEFSSWETLNLNFVWESTSVSIISKTWTIQSSRLVNLNVCSRASLYEVWKPQGAEESHLTVFQLNSLYHCSAKQSVVDSNHCM